MITLSRPPAISSLKITDRSFRYASPRLWNQLPDSFRQPRQSCLDSPPHSLVSSSLLSSPLSSPITPSLFHISSKPTFSTNLPTLDFFCLPDCFHDNWTGSDLLCEIFSPSGSQAILAFPYQTGWRYSDGNPSNGGVECR